MAKTNTNTNTNIITEINRAACRLVDAEALAALEAVATKFGLTVKLKPGSFNSNMFRSSFEFATVGENGQSNDSAAQEFRAWAFAHKIPESALGADFVSRNRTFTLVGYSRRSAKYPFLARSEDGRTFKFSLETIAAKFGTSKGKTAKTVQKAAPKTWLLGQEIMAKYSDGAWYPATYAQPAKTPGKHKVLFDDGDRGIVTGAEIRSRR